MTEKASGLADDGGPHRERRQEAGVLTGVGDRWLACTACGRHLLWPEGEPTFYRSLGYAAPPVP